MHGLLLDGARPALPVEGDDAIAGRLVHLIAEDRGSAAPGVRPPQPLGQAMPVEQVVAERKRARVGPDELPSDQERPGDPGFGSGPFQGCVRAQREFMKFVRTIHFPL